MASMTVYRQDYQPPVFSVENIDLIFDLRHEDTIVTNRMVLKRQSPGMLCLYGDELELISIMMNDDVLSKKAYSFEGSDLILENCPDEMVLEIKTRILPQNNTQLSGLYRSNGLYCTQCEAQGFRRITFFPDRPDVLSIYTTKIIADKTQYPVLLSNGNQVDSGELDNNRHWVLWQDPFKKPSYLFALVAGKLGYITDQFTTQSARKVDLKIFVEPGYEEQCTHAMVSLKKAMTWDEEKYGREYDLDTFMIVAVSDFNMGAMENKGLNIFNSKYILARPDTATDDDYANIESVVAHEYFHNWTGNRVTCRDWFQLSLKEGLTVFRDQEFSRDMNSRDVNRILDVKVLRNAQFPEDAGAMAHPVRPESYQEINNFYTATVYNKGAEVIRMQQTLVGADGFRKGTDLYFQRFDGQAVTIDDFVGAIEDANSIDLTQFKRWYSQAGTPEIKVSRKYSGGQLALTLSQLCRPTPECREKKPFHIPIKVALFDKAGNLLPIENSVLELRQAEQTFYFKNLTEEPVVSLLRDFSAPIVIKQTFDPKELLSLMRHETDGFAKWNAAQNLTRHYLEQFYQTPLSEWHLSSDLVSAYQSVLHDLSADEALRAELLSPPGFNDVAMHLSKIDVGQLEQARDFYRQELGRKLWPTLQEIYQALWQQETHTMAQDAFGRRRLRNQCLFLMMKSREADALSDCQKQFEEAQTMTDQVASFNLLAHCSDAKRREQAVELFYQQWQAYDLVIEKWLSVQACSEQPGTLARVETLLSHPAFSFNNPNKVRALIGMFCQGNPRHFHAIDGSGYIFLKEMLLKLDGINPQVAARLATPFTRWQRYDSKRQKLIQEQLQELSAAKLSRDLTELVQKSLVQTS